MLSSLGAKIAAGGVILLGILLAALRLIGMGKSIERGKSAQRTVKNVEKVKKARDSITPAERDKLHERFRR